MKKCIIFNKSFDPGPGLTFHQGLDRAVGVATACGLAVHARADLDLASEGDQAELGIRCGSVRDEQVGQTDGR